MEKPREEKTSLMLEASPEGPPFTPPRFLTASVMVVACWSSNNFRVAMPTVPGISITGISIRVAELAMSEL